MTWATIRPEVKATLAAVVAPAVVHDYQRYTHDMSQFLALFKTSAGVISGWIVTREGVGETDADHSTNDTQHRIKIRGYYGLKDADASELVFQDLVDAVVAAFRSNYQLNGAANHTTPMQAPVIDLRMFGAVLCHYCELTMTAEEYNAWG